MAQLPPHALERYCIRCGASEDNATFRSPSAMKCTSCDLHTDEERKAYHRLYHKARGRATRRLIAMYQREFDIMLAHEHEKAKAEDAEKVRLAQSVA